MSTRDLSRLTSDIVAAYVEHNHVQPDKLPDLLGTVHATLVLLSMPVQARVVVEAAVPAVPIKKSVLGDRIICLCCGKSFATLKRHIRTDHCLEADDYRDRFGLPRTYPMTCEDYSKRRTELAKRAGLGRGRLRGDPQQVEAIEMEAAGIEQPSEVIEVQAEPVRAEKRVTSILKPKDRAKASKAIVADDTAPEVVEDDQEASQEAMEAA